MKRILLPILTFLYVVQFTGAFAQAPNYAWAVQSNSGNSSDVAGSLVAVDLQHGAVYTAGWFQGGAIDLGSGLLDNVNPSSGTHDIFVAKYTAGGTLVWVKAFGGYGDDALTGLATDGNGNVFIAGNYNSDSLWFNNGKIALNPTSTLSTSVYNEYLAKLDASGNTQWVKTGTLTGTSSISPSGNSMVTTDGSNNVYLTGSVNGSVQWGSQTISTVTGSAMYVLKMDNNGNIAWSAQSTSLTTNLNPGSVVPYAITTDGDGNCVVAGAFSDDNSFGATVINTSNDLYFDRFVAKLDKTNGHFLWAAGAGAWQGPDVNYGIATDANNNVYLTGTLSYPTAGPNNSANRQEFFVEKLSASGDSSWIVTSATNVASGAIYAGKDAAGNIYVALSVNDTVADFGGIHISIPPPNSFGVAGITHFVLKYDGSGNVAWAKKSNETGIIPMAMAGGIALDNAGCIYVTGTISDSSAFDSHLLIGNTSTNDVFLADLCNNPSSAVSELANGIEASLYPNPAADKVVLQWQSDVNEPYTVEIENMQGQKVKTISTGFNGQGLYTLNVDVSDLESGIYLLGLRTGHTATYQKLVVQK